MRPQMHTSTRTYLFPLLWLCHLLSRGHASDMNRPKYVKPKFNGDLYFMETFDESNLIGTRWIVSSAQKGSAGKQVAKYDGVWSVEQSTLSAFDGDNALVLKSKSKHHAISTRLGRPFDFKKNRTLIVQYEVKFDHKVVCGGAYVKLLSQDSKLILADFNDQTQFTLMFGPDRCNRVNKNHFIVRVKNPVSGVYEESVVQKADLPDRYFHDKKTHLFTLILKPEGSFRILIDLNETYSGHLLHDFMPPIQPPTEINDPNDREPSGLENSDALKYSNAWNEPSKSERKISLEDKKLSKADCDSKNSKNEADKSAKTNLENLLSKPTWRPRQIPNPNYYKIENVFESLAPISAVGLELWSMNDQIHFDNFLITDDEKMAHQFALNSWKLKHNLELYREHSDNFILRLVEEANEQPWLWLLYAIFVLLPIAMLIVTVCNGVDRHRVGRGKTANCWYEKFTTVKHGESRVELRYLTQPGSFSTHTIKQLPSSKRETKKVTNSDIDLIEEINMNMACDSDPLMSENLSSSFQVEEPSSLRYRNNRGAAN